MIWMILFGIIYLACMVWAFIALLVTEQFHASKPNKGFNLINILVIIFAPISGSLLALSLPYIFSDRVSEFVDRYLKKK